jgi:hypothetical protein
MELRTIVFNSHAEVNDSILVMMASGFLCFLTLMK